MYIQVIIMTKAILLAVNQSLSTTGKHTQKTFLYDSVFLECLKEMFLQYYMHIIFFSKIV